MQALLKIAAGGLVTAVMLTSCTGADPARETTTAVPAPSASTAAPTAPAQAPTPPEPADKQSATASPSPPPPSGSTDAKGGGAGKGAHVWGRYGDRADACAAVAANVASLLLVPLGFMTGVKDSELKSLQDELGDFSRDVPPALTDDLRRIERVLKRSAPDRDFDVTAFAEALQPVQDWLVEHCGE